MCCEEAAKQAVGQQTVETSLRNMDIQEAQCKLSFPPPVKRLGRGAWLSPPCLRCVHDGEGPIRRGVQYGT